MSAYTKGPWEIETPLDRFNQGSEWDADEDWFPDYPSKVTVRAKYEICKMSGVHQATLADARLIAAAPELLEALKECEWSDGGGCPQCAATQGEPHQTKCILANALAKATGGDNADL